MKKVVPIAIGVLVVAGLALVLVRRLHEKNDAPTLVARPVPVRVARVVPGRVVQKRHLLGRVVGADEAQLAPRVMGRILGIRVREGDRVQEGQMLATLDSRELEDAVAQAQAGLDAAREAQAAARTAYLAQRDATARDRKLFEAKALSKEQWDRSRAVEAASSARLAAAKSQVTVAKRRLDQVRTRLAYTRIVAPFAGVVAARFQDPGDLAVPGRPLLELVRQENVRVRARAPAQDLAHLAIGQPVRLTAGGKSLDATVSRVFPSMGKDRLAAFEVDLQKPPPGFVSGAAVGVDLDLAGASGRTVPADALLEGGNGAFVFVVKDGVVHPVRVKVAGRSVTAAVVEGDVKAGDAVVVARPSRLMRLADGVKVKVSSSGEHGPAEGRDAP